MLSADWRPAIPPHCTTKQTTSTEHVCILAPFRGIGILSNLPTTCEPCNLHLKVTYGTDVKCLYYCCCFCCSSLTLPGEATASIRLHTHTAHTHTAVPHTSPTCPPFPHTPHLPHTPFHPSHLSFITPTFPHVCPHT